MKRLIVLHLEDDIDDAELVLAELNSTNFDIDYKRVDTEHDFVDQLDNSAVDIILADFQLPKFNGIAALRICVEKYPEIPFVFVSGTIGEENAVRTLQNGASDYLLKNNLKRLVPSIERALKEAKSKIEHQRMELELRASEERFRMITENSADAIFIASQNEQFQFVNRAAANMLGYSQEEMRKMNVFDLAPDPHQAERMMKLFNQLIAEGSLIDELFLRRKDGSYVPVDLNAIVMPNGLLYGSCRDITSRKLTEEALLQSEKKYRSIFENTQDVYYQSNIEGYFVEISPSIKQLLGYSPEELIGKHTSVLYNNLENRDLLLSMLVEFGEVYDYELQLRTIDNTIKYTSLNAHFINDHQGTRIGVEGSLRDIDERKQFEISLAEAKVKAEESDRLKTSFLNNISHEIRTPMNSIIGFSNFLKQPNLALDKRVFFANIIAESSYHLLSIINDIVDIATVEAKQVKLNEKSFNLNEALLFVSQQMKSSADRQGIELSFSGELADREAFVIMDETKLIQILSNLVSNAIKFTHVGNVHFGYSVGHSLVFYIKDTGVGIPEQMFDVIFERFRQLDYSNEKIYGGSGLGLSIAKAYVELMKGKIWVESELGKGSTFYVELPLKMANKVATAPKVNFVNELGNVDFKGKLLIAEDEDINFFLLREIMEQNNIPYLRAIDGIEAISMATNELVMLVLMDLKMPRLDGYVATKTIRTNKPELPIIALTSYIGDRQRQRALEAGCVDFIEKPVNKEILLAKIAKYILPE